MESSAHSNAFACANATAAAACLRSASTLAGEGREGQSEEEGQRSMVSALEFFRLGLGDVVGREERAEGGDAARSCCSARRVSCLTRWSRVAASCTTADVAFSCAAVAAATTAAAVSAAAFSS